jgi:hypothetical protein
MYVFGGDYITLYNSLDSFFCKIGAKMRVFLVMGAETRKKVIKTK